MAIGLFPSGAYGLFRLNTDGSLDTTFGPAPNHVILHLFEALATSRDDSILVVDRRSWLNEGEFVHRLREDGSLGETIRLPVDGSVKVSLLEEGQGNLIVATERSLYRFSKEGKQLLSLPLRVRQSEHYVLEILGIQQTQAVLWLGSWIGLGAFEHRLFRISLEEPPPETALVIDPTPPTGIGDWDEWKARSSTFPRLPTEEIEGLKKSVRVRRFGDTRRPASATVFSRDGTARAGEDYVAIQTRVTFAPYEQERTIEITVLDDGMLEPDESFELVLSEAAGVEEVGPAMPIRILDRSSGLRLGNLRPMSDGSVEVSFNWLPGYWYNLEASNNLRNWTNLNDSDASYYMDSGHRVRVIDAGTAKAEARYYRLSILPPTP